MNNQIYREADVSLSPLQNQTIAIIGYGAQGRSHALNLRDSGLSVIIGQRKGGAGHENAIADGFKPISIAQACADATVISIQLPDEIHGDVFKAEIESQLNPNKYLIFCHGFSVHFHTIELAEKTPVLLVAPKGAGHMVRSEFENGGGVPCLFALGPNADQTHQPIALAYAAGLGGARAGIMETTFAEETETDLFGEQAVLCGGMSHLVMAAFDTLVEAGYRPEMAYFECLHELKLTVDLLHRGGLAKMRDLISNTAEFGDYTSGPQVIDDSTRERLKEILANIQSGEFARKWMAEYKNGLPTMQNKRAEQSTQLIEKVGDNLRENMIWSKQKSV